MASNGQTWNGGNGLRIVYHFIWLYVLLHTSWEQANFAPSLRKPHCNLFRWGSVVYFIEHKSREASQMIVDIGKIEVHVFIEVALFERETCFHINKNYKQSNNSFVYILRLNTFFFIQGNIVPRTTIYIACAFIDDYACSVLPWETHASEQLHLTLSRNKKYYKTELFKI